MERNNVVRSNSTGYQDREIARIEQAALAHIHEAEFDVQALAYLLKMSRSTLKRRIAVACGLSAGSYLRQLRMQRAHYHLSNGHFKTMTETARAVGYRHAGYFIRRYREFCHEQE